MKYLVVPLATLLLFACEQGPAPLTVDERDTPFLGPDGKADNGDIEEGSVDSCGVLRVVNETSFEILDLSAPDGVGLDRRAALGIVSYRAGDDGFEGTEDDQQLESLAVLDAIPWVGPVAFGDIHEYAIEEGFVEACSTPPSDDDQFSFFVIGDSRSHPEVLESIVQGMVALDPEAVMAFNTGDITSYGTYAQWSEHLETLARGAPDPSVPEDPAGIVRQSRLRTDVDSFGPWIRYIGVLGNHDDNNGEWFGSWNSHLPGQRLLGRNDSDGVYFTLSYGNALFIVLDSVNPSEAQTAWLEGVLESEEAQGAFWVFALFHHPVYPCNDKVPFADGLEWVELFEQHAVDAVFVAHSHTYERTCPMIGGRCDETGVPYINSSAAGAPVRAIDADRIETVSFDGRTDEFDCGEILESGQGHWDHFCHIEINRCRFRLACYDHDWGERGGPPYDTMVIDRCD